jgi:hypothetical protein
LVKASCRAGSTLTTIRWRRDRLIGAPSRGVLPGHRGRRGGMLAPRSIGTARCRAG